MPLVSQPTQSSAFLEAEGPDMTGLCSDLCKPMLQSLPGTVQQILLFLTPTLSKLGDKRSFGSLIQETRCSSVGMLQVLHEDIADQALDCHVHVL